MRNDRPESGFTSDVNSIVGRSRYRKARFGIALHALDNGTVLFERDADYFFSGASTTKLVTVASALASLGPEYRFRTVIRHTGKIDDGTLKGDLILVASGDPNLSARVASDDTLGFEHCDHALGGEAKASAVPGDPLVVIRKLARDVAAFGITRICGDVHIDISLFSEGFRELGTFAVVSPIVINDNLIDIIATAGDHPGEPLALTFSPPTDYVTFRSTARVGALGSRPRLTISDERCDANRKRTVDIGGTLPPGLTLLYNHPVATPSAFARAVLIDALAEVGIAVDTILPTDVAALAQEPGIEGNVLAVHVSPPFREAAKIINKVSQNLHAELCPRVVGAAMEGVRGPGAEQAGFERMARFLEASGIDTDGMVLGDSCGTYGYFTPTFMCRFLRSVDRLPFSAAFRASLPILGVDGTLHDIQSASPAAGHVAAKTGTMGFVDKLCPRAMVAAKGLAGYIETASGERLVFAAYANMVALEPGEVMSDVGQALGEIATAAFTRF
jgi:D-alanyl-D-alanine carboxypeptidase/D-alanyl-D-alanine-endopeptidase (penicillin-binding protein 4)